MIESVEFSTVERLVHPRDGAQADVCFSFLRRNEMQAQKNRRHDAVGKDSLNCESVLFVVRLFSSPRRLDRASDR